MNCGRQKRQVYMRVPQFTLHLKTDIEAVCSSAFRRRDAMLVPRHMSLFSTAHGCGCCGAGDGEAPGGVPPEAAGIPAARPGGATVGEAVSAP